MNKKHLLAALLLLLTLVLVSCGGIDAEKADKACLGYINAVLAGDVPTASGFLHPQFAESALPTDDYYEKLDSEYYISRGDVLTGLDSIDKRYSEDTSLSGTVLECSYVACIDNMVYDIKLIILDNEEGYGIIGFDIGYCTDEKYYNAEN